MDCPRLLMIDLAGPRLSADERTLLRDYPVGGICLFQRNLIDRLQAAELTAELRSLLGPQLLIATDQEGGTVVRARDLPFPPSAMALGAAADLALTRQLAAATARGLRSIGINVNFAPVADVNTNPNNPVIGERAFGSEPQAVAQQVAAFIAGHQAAGVAATAKHFPGHGDAAVDSHLALPVLAATRAQLEAVELVPFKAAISAGVAAVMSYHGVIRALDPQQPATLSPAVMTGLLREQLGFGGVCFSDALEMQAIAARFSPAEAVVRALEAGVDMALYNLHGGSLKVYQEIVAALAQALRDGRLSPELLAAKLARIAALAQRYPAAPNPETAWQPGDAMLMRKAARQAVVKLGDGPPLTGGPIALISAHGELGGGAGDAAAHPAAQLAAMLAAQGFSVAQFTYNPADVASSRATLLAAAAYYPTLFISAARTPLTEAEIALAHAIARRAPRFWHLALGNPFAACALPGPAVVSFGFWPHSLEAALAVLRGAPAYGRAPALLHHR